MQAHEITFTSIDLGQVGALPGALASSGLSGHLTQLPYASPKKNQSRLERAFLAKIFVDAFKQQQLLGSVEVNQDLTGLTVAAKTLAEFGR